MNCFAHLSEADLEQKACLFIMVAVGIATMPQGRKILLGILAMVGTVMLGGVLHHVTLQGEVSLMQVRINSCTRISTPSTTLPCPCACPHLYWSMV